MSSSGKIKTSAKTDLRNHIYMDLREKIINCVYKPGEVLSELRLTEDYGVSRTPIREAISRLEPEGYVEILPKKGIRITDITLDDAVQIFETRLRMEPVCLKMAYPFLELKDLLELRNTFFANKGSELEKTQTDMAMHLYIIDRCGSRYMIEMMHKLFDDNLRLVTHAAQNSSSHIEEAYLEHLDLLDSLIRQTGPEEPMELLKIHIQSCRMAALKSFY